MSDTINHDAGVNLNIEYINSTELGNGFYDITYKVKSRNRLSMQKFDELYNLGFFEDGNIEMSLDSWRLSPNTVCNGKELQVYDNYRDPHTSVYFVYEIVVKGMV